MCRSLLWKEWRDQRGVLVSSLVLVVVVPAIMAGATVVMGRADDALRVLEVLPFAYPLVLWPLIAIAAGAVAFTADAEDGRWAHLLTRPVDRLGVWAAKVIGVVLVVLAVVLASELVTGALAWGAGLPVASGPVDQLGRAGNLVLFGVPGLLMLCASTAALCGLVLRRQLVAALLGALMAGLLFLVIAATVWYQDIVPALGMWTLTWRPALVAALLAASSMYAFRRGELLVGRRFVLMGSLAALSGLALGTLVLVAVAGYGMRPPGRGALLAQLRGGPGPGFVATAARPDGLRSRTLVAGSAAADELSWPAGRLTDRGAVSPDGTAAAWTDARGPLGLLGPRLQLRIRWGADQPAAIAVGDLGADPRTGGRVGEPAFSPDGQAVVVQGQDALWIAHRDGGPATRFALEVGCLLVGWDGVTAQPMVHCPRLGTRRPSAVLQWVDAQAGTVAEELVLPAATSRRTPRQLDPRGFMVLPLIAYEGTDAAGTGTTATSAVTSLSALDLRDRSLRPLQRWSGRAHVEAAASGESMAWIVARRGQDDDNAQLWSTDATHPEPRLVGDGWPRSFPTGLSLSPDGSWAVVTLLMAGGPSTSAVLAVRLNDGHVRELASLGDAGTGLDGVLAWTGPARLAVLAEPASEAKARPAIGADALPDALRGGYRGWYRAIRLIDLATGEERTIRP